MPASLAELNSASEPRFVEVCGPWFEKSPWIAQRAIARRPFATREALHAALCAEVQQATPDEQLALIRAHPDLVGRLARAGQLTQESTREQAAAGLTELGPDEVRQFEQFNAAYWQRFGFPFVICARENKKNAILQAFPLRLANSREQELATALAEVFKIARLRLEDAVQEG